MTQSLLLLAKALLRHGVTAHEFARWADAAFVRAAVDLLKAQGTDPSFSRISAITGIHRHAVSAILGGSAGNRPAEASSKEYQRHRLARVLSGWFEDPSFTDEEGHPMALPMDGTAPCFSNLVRAYSGDIYPGIILDELLRVGAVQRASDGKLLAVSRRYTTGGVDEAAVSHADVVVADILRTIGHNMEAPPSERFYEDSAIAVNAARCGRKAGQDPGTPRHSLPRRPRGLARQRGARTGGARRDHPEYPCRCEGGDGRWAFPSWS